MPRKTKKPAAPPPAPNPPAPDGPPDAEAICDRLLRAADLRSRYLLEQAQRNPAAFKGAWELQILIYAVGGVVEAEHRRLLALAKLSPEDLGRAIAANAAMRGVQVPAPAVAAVGQGGGEAGA